MEDLHQSSSPPAPSFDHSALSQASPPPVIVQSKPAKKRKSWGQELPEPKTALPPRKRAKTDDEKEQRRIERIKRNRAAAHNSRERKRQETETLAVANARLQAELDAYKKLHGPLPAHIVLPEVTLSRVDEDAPTPAATASTPAPSLVESHGSVYEAPSPASPAESTFSQPTIKQEPFDNAYPSMLPPAFDNLDSKSSMLSPLDLTQHSAAMLCDLQCQSSSLSSSTTSQTSWWATLFLYLMNMNLQICYRTLLVAIWTLSPSRMARLMQVSALHSSRSTISSMTPRLLRSTPGRLARLNAATGLRAPQGGANALARQSPDEVQRARVELIAKKQAQADQTRMALSEQLQGTARGQEDRTMGDDGDETHGVWSDGLS